MIMKKTIIFYWAFLSVSLLQAQTLEKTLKLVGFVAVDSVVASTQPNEHIVPAGRIWKVENIIIDGSISGTVFINSTNTPIINTNNSTITYRGYDPHSPVWLNAGEKILFRSNAFTYFRYKFSAFEFVME
jgi:hypothetical protein